MPMLEARGTTQGHDVGILLSLLGYHSATLFAEQLSSVKLTPAHAGIVRAVAAHPGRSQQALSADLGVAPSRLVRYVDDLEKQGVVERRRHQTDRRLYALFLTDRGRDLLDRLHDMFRERNRRLTSGLDQNQCDVLRDLLARMARQEGLKPLAHPAFRQLGDHSKTFG